MATNLDLDDKLIRQVQKLGKFTSKREAVNTAMREYTQRHSQASILELAGKVEYDVDYDYKKTPNAEIDMNVLIDTSVWSIGLRRQRCDLNPAESKAYYGWSDLLKNGDAALVGPIIQEVLSGIADAAIFESLQKRLRTVVELSIATDTWILAAQFFNQCRRSGVAPGAIDMTICAAANENDLPIFTVDPDFAQYARVLPIRLYRP